MDIHKVGIVGGGKMATEIFKLLGEQDVEVALWTPFPQEVEAAEAELTRKLKRRVAKGGTKGAAAEEKLAQMRFSTDMDVLADADLIIEAVIESLEPKRKVFAALDKVVQPDALFVTNTSSLSPSSIASVTTAARQTRFAGLHYFYPVSLISFVEVIPARNTDTPTIDTLMSFVRNTRRTPVLVRKEVNAYLVNRMLAAFYNEGADIVAEGYWLPGEIDEIARRFASMGPCESVDYAGVDVLVNGSDSTDASWGRKDHISKQYRGHKVWPRAYYRLHEDGRFGRKTGVGFYRYVDGQPVEDPEYFATACPQLPDFHIIPEYDDKVVEKRLYLAVLLEAVMTFERGIGSKEDIDATLKEMLGLEQAPFAYIEEHGIDAVREQCRALAATVGDSLAPVGFLRGPDDPIRTWEQDPFFV